MTEKILQIGKGKKSFTLSNGNTVELDPNDFNVIVRLKEVFGDLESLKEEAQKLSLASEKEDFNEVALTLQSLNSQMREKIDHVFDGPVSESCAGNAGMLDVLGGKCRYEVIVEGLLAAYEDSIEKEAKALQKRINKATPAKYKKHPGEK